VSDVINDVVGMLIGLGPVGAALLWCDLQDRFRHRANRVGADMRATANRVLGGESMLAVRVQPAIAWRPGRVHLSTPRRLRIPDRERLLDQRGRLHFLEAHLGLLPDALAEADDLLRAPIDRREHFALQLVPGHGRGC